MCIALFHNACYQCVKFQVNSFNSLEVMARKKLKQELTKDNNLKDMSSTVMVLVHCTSS